MMERRRQHLALRMAAFLRTGRAMKEKDAFTFIRDAARSKEIRSAFAQGG
jgi:hypothetical protein